MKQVTNNEKRLTQYLLGQMRLEDQTRIEEQYLADPDFHQELRATERDLIDQYIHGELSKPEQDQFEKHFLSSPRRRQRVEFARALMQSLAQGAAVADRAGSSEERISGWASLLHLLSGRHRVWLSAAATVVILAGGWLLIVNRQKENSPKQVVQTQKPGLTRPPDVTGQQKPPAPPQPEVVEPKRPAVPPVQVATIVLMPGLSRNTDETPTLVIEGNLQVSLQLHLETGGYKSYRAMLRTAEGDEVWSQDRLQPQSTRSGQTIIVKLPASRFSSRDYTIKLSGVTPGGEFEEVSSYYFRVKRK
jgi:hypothetical protein